MRSCLADGALVNSNGISMCKHSSVWPRLGDRDISRTPIATVSHFSMHFAILTTDSVWVEKRELGGRWEMSL